jgi:hypothetical protein
MPPKKMPRDPIRDVGRLPEFRAFASHESNCGFLIHVRVLVGASPTTDGLQARQTSGY